MCPYSSLDQGKKLDTILLYNLKTIPGYFGPKVYNLYLAYRYIYCGGGFYLSTLLNDLLKDQTKY